MAGRLVLIATLVLVSGCVEEAPILNRPCECATGFHCCSLSGKGICLRQDQQCHAGDPTARLLPVVAGGQWVYRVTNRGKVTEKTQTVSGLEPVPQPPWPHPGWDRQGYRIDSDTTLNGQAVEKKTSWQAVEEDRVLWLHEVQGDDSEWFRVPRLRLDESPEHVKWSEHWTRILSHKGVPSTEIPREDRWEVLGEEPVSVPAGHFRCVVFQRGDKTYWFSRGVGKVKEVAEEGKEREELVKFTLAK